MSEREQRSPIGHVVVEGHDLTAAIVDSNLVTNDSNAADWDVVLELSTDVTGADASRLLDDMAGRIVRVEFRPIAGRHRGKALRGNARIHMRKSGDAHVHLTGVDPLTDSARP